MQTTATLEPATSKWTFYQESEILKLILKYQSFRFTLTRRRLFVIFIRLSFLILSNFIFAKNEMKFFLLDSILRKYPVKQECHEEKTPLMLPIFLMIPFEEKSSEAPKTSHKQTKTGVSDIQTSELSRLKFPEMRNGILSTRCHCVHRDGLQDYCPLSQCQKEPECLDKPWPSCLPAKYLQSRHPEQYPPFKH